MKKIISKSLIVLSIVFFTIFTSCTSNDCEYINVENVSGVNLCASKNILNISTGIDESGNVIAPGVNAIDPYWRLINRPLFSNNSFGAANDLALMNSINGSSFIVDFVSSDDTYWVNLDNSSPLSAVNAGITTEEFGIGTVTNNGGYITPYIFERSFCVNKEVNLIIDLEARGSVLVFFELVNNVTNTVLVTSQDINSSIDSWYEVVSVQSGSYSIRASLLYKTNNLPAFSVVGNISTADNSLTLTNNKNNCCSNNIVGLILINDADCNNTFDSNFDTILYQNAVANILNSSGTVVSTQNVDANGNIIFTGLPDGTYTINIIILDSLSLISPNNFQVTLSNNEVKNFNIFVCP